jgi:catechol 2,3-dioxygenase-like lactoylglutathione lyase family enzyme
MSRRRLVSGPPATLFSAAPRARFASREAGPVKGGNTVIAFVTDPDGYRIELIQRSTDSE